MGHSNVLFSTEVHSVLTFLSKCSVSFSSWPHSPAAWLPSFPPLHSSSSKWVRLKRRPPATSQSLMRESLLAKLIVLFPVRLPGGNCRLLAYMNVSGIAFPG